MFNIIYIQLSSVAQSCPTLCDPMNRSIPGLTVHHQPTPRVHSDSCPSSRWCHPAVSSSVIPFSSYLQSFPASESFPIGLLFASGGQSSISPSNEYSGLVSFKIGWFDLLLSKGHSRVFSSTTVQKHHFFGIQPFLLSSSHIHTLEKSQLWLDRPLSTK